MGIRETWINSFSEGKTRLWTLEEYNEVGLYQTKSSYMYRGNEFYDSPVYHVWNKDRNVISTLNYIEAYNVFLNIKRSIIAMDVEMRQQHE